MQMQSPTAALGDGQILQNLGLPRRAEPLCLLDAIVLGGRFQCCQRGDAEVLVEPQHLLRTQTRHRHHLEDARWDLLPELIEARRSAGSLQLGDDFGDGFANARNFGEPALGDQHIERDGEGARLSAARA
jgi:hypothetical protein